MIKSLSSIKQNRSKDLSKIKNFSRSFKGIKLYNFSEIESYSKIKRPLLTQVKKQYLKRRLDIENTAEARMRERARLNDLYVPYNYNPFSHSQPHAKSETNIQSNQQGGNAKPAVVHKNILNEIHRTKYKKTIDRRKQARALVAQQENAQRISNTFQQQVKQSTVAGERAKPSKPRLIVTEEDKKQDETFFEDTVDQFSQIVRMADHNYYWRKNQTIDIFKQLYQGDTLLSRNVLDRYYFSFSLATEKNMKTKVPLQRQVSREARKIINKKPNLDVENMEPFDISNLNFDDILNVAAGRFTPEYVGGSVNPYKQREQYSEIDSDDIVYGLNTANYAASISNDALENKQVLEFFRINLTPKQAKYMKTCINHKNHVQLNLKTEAQLLSRRVYDRKQHLDVRNKIAEGLERFIDSEYFYPVKNTERDRVISKNKESKNKTQNIKLEHFNQTLTLQNQQNERIRQLIRKRL